MDISLCLVLDLSINIGPVWLERGDQGLSLDARVIIGKVKFLR